MSVVDVLSAAWTNLSRRKGRTALTAAGVVVGVAALVLMVSLGIGLQRQFLQLFETEDAFRTLTVGKPAGDSKGKGNPFALMMGDVGTPLTEADLVELRGVPGVESVSPELNLFLKASVEGRPGGVFHPVAGLLPADEARLAKHLAQGRMWTKGEQACLLPSSLLEMQLRAKPEDVLGRKVLLKGMVAGAQGDEDAFECVGILDAESLGLRGRQIFLPMDLALDVRERRGAGMMGLSKKGTYLAAEVRAKDPAQAADLARRLKGSGWSVLAVADVVKQINVVFLVVEAFLACIGAIGLVVSLFGIANTMAMAVLERTREIGVMKALGARDRDVSRLFLAEAGAIGLLGGVLGTLLGWLAGQAGNALARAAQQMPDRVSLFHVPLWLAAGAVGFSVLVSVIAGVFPARGAARMEPVAALRYE
jgi:putative ABC transport system permease protein